MLHLLNLISSWSRRHPAQSLESSMQSHLPLAPGMGLSLEVWQLIIDFLEIDALSLYACCLTCTTFRAFAEPLLLVLKDRLYINISDYVDITQLKQEFFVAPSRAKCFSMMSLSHREEHIGPGECAGIPPIVVPYQLGAANLTSLTKLILTYNITQNQAHPSTWPLFGRPFRQITTLELQASRFPSFVEFIKLLTAFTALKDLNLGRVSCAHQVVPPSISRNPYRQRRLDINIDCLTANSAQCWFIETFSSWVIPRGGFIQRFMVQMVEKARVD